MDITQAAFLKVLNKNLTDLFRSRSIMYHTRIAPRSVSKFCKIGNNSENPENQTVEMLHKKHKYNMIDIKLNLLYFTLYICMYVYCVHIDSTFSIFKEYTSVT